MMSFKSFCEKMNKLSKRIRIFLSFGLIFIGSSLVFVSGIFYSDASLESDSVFISNLAEESLNKQFVSAQITPKNESASSNMPSTYNEYYYWKYIFRHSNFGFVSTVNGGKTHSCLFKNLNDDSNITFLCSGYNSNPAYGDFYKHEVYDLRLMFPGNNAKRDGAISFLAVSQTKANDLLLSKGVVLSDGGYSLEQYESLLQDNITIVMDNVDCEFSISNIYFEDGEFFENVKKTFGEFVLSYIRFPDGFAPEASYIFNKYDYQNYHKLKRMKYLFDESNFSFRFSNYNLKSDINLDAFNNRILSNNSSFDFLSILLMCVSCLLVLLGIFSIFVYKEFYNLKSIIIFNGLFVFPYSALFIINMFKKIPLIFSYYSLKVFLLLSIVMILFDMFLIFFMRRKEV